MIQKMFIDIEDTDDTHTNLENLIKIHKKIATATGNHCCYQGSQCHLKGRAKTSYSL